VVPPETRYAKSGPVNIAYQVVGESALDLVMVPGFVSHVEVAWEEPTFARFLTRLASFSRLILFDKRGTGMSDPVTGPPTMDERMDDIRAVMDAVGSARAAIFGVSEGGTLSILFAHRHPDRAHALVLYGSWARRLAAPDYPWGLQPEELEGFLHRMGDAWATGEWWTPSPSEHDSLKRWWARFLRMSASPAMAQGVIRMNTEIDVRGLLPELRVPTLVLHRTGDNWIVVEHGRYLADNIPGARYVELSGVDHRIPAGEVEPILTEIEIFLTGHKSRPRRHSFGGVDALSQREREVALLASRGETAAVIAAQLVISERTVETHLASVYVKLGVRSKAELIRRAGELGI
jgi:pimeloyl-ACP methyl ester carboxylesterase/DNA-binding CsgD family transcriptional regulator